MPALASTKSSRPNSASPRSTTVGEPFAVADVRVLGHDAPARLLDQPHRFLEVLRGGHRVGDTVELRAQVDGDDVGTLFGEPDGVFAALSPRGARHEHDPAGETSVGLLRCHDRPAYGLCQNGPNNETRGAAVASTEVERYAGVDVEDVPSAKWGWSKENPRLQQIGGILAGVFLLLMMHGNHQGHVEDWFLIAGRAAAVRLRGAQCLPRP